jgi:Mg2+/Co2+ transporter CorB
MNSNKIERRIISLVNYIIAILFCAFFSKRERCTLIASRSRFHSAATAAAFITEPATA